MNGNAQHPETPDARTPFQRMADLTRRVVAVPKEEVVKPKKRVKR